MVALFPSSVLMCVESSSTVFFVGWQYFFWIYFKIYSTVLTRGMREFSCEFLPINLVELLEIKFIQGLVIPSSPCGVYCSIFKTQPFASWSLISLTGVCVPRTPAPGKLWFPVLFLLCLPWRILADLSIACFQLIQPYSSCVAGAFPRTSFRVQVGKQEVTGNHFLCRFPSLYGPWWRVCSNLQSSLICDFFSCWA